MSNSGLGQGIGALFQTKTTSSQTEVAEKTRTTLRLHTKTILLIDELKLEAKRRGEKLTVSDIVDEAIAMYASQFNAPDS